MYATLHRTWTQLGDLPYLLPLSELLSVAGFLLAVVLAAQLLGSRRPVATTISWLLVIVLIPWVGVPLYLTFGGRKLRTMASRKAKVYQPAGIPDAESFGGGAERVLRSYGVPPASPGNSVRLLTDGVTAFREVLALIDGATSSLHLTTYILGQDVVGEAVVEHLAARAAAGVDVRVLLDDLGSWRVKRGFLEPITSAGGTVAFFMPVIHWPLRGRTNLRNHRKVIVADGTRALAGGMNLAEEYMGPTADPKRWRDLALIVEGPAAGDLDDLFRSDWSFATNPGDAEEPPSIPASHRNPRTITGAATPPAGTPVQVVASGPDTEGDPLYESLVSLLFAARRRIWVVTPYFIPDEILTSGLELAVRRGVDVRLVVPDHSNHPTADLARITYLRQVLDAGGQVLRYRPSMVHAKAVLVDDDLAVIGSANMDMRSLFLNYEVALFLFAPDQVRAADAYFQSLFPDCRPGLRPQTRLSALGENLVRLLSPLL